MGRDSKILLLIFPTSRRSAYGVSMRHPDKTEIEFFLLMVLLVVPFGYVVIRTLLALVGV